MGVFKSVDPITQLVNLFPEVSEGLSACAIFEATANEGDQILGDDDDESIEAGKNGRRIVGDVKGVEGFDACSFCRHVPGCGRKCRKR